MAATKPTSVVLTRAGLRSACEVRAEPPQALRESLALARASGSDFDSSWESSVQSALYGYRGSARHDWSYAIRETREVWRSAYLVERAGRLERWAGVLEEARSEALDGGIALDHSI